MRCCVSAMPRTGRAFISFITGPSRTGDYRAHSRSRRARAKEADSFPLSE
jgi:hypothetical protein